MRRRFAALLVSFLVLTAQWLVVAPAHAAMDVAKQVLIGADYSDKDLRGATFNLSNLREATLDSAVMTGTNLSDAVLEGSFAFNTRFKDVVITGADFTDVPMRGDQLKSLCAVADGVNSVTGRSTRESLGCA